MSIHQRLGAILECVAFWRRSSSSPSSDKGDQAAADAIDRELRKLNFYRWLVCGTGGCWGLSNVVNLWLVLHVGIGLVLHYVIPMSVDVIAGSAVLPLASILIGLVFAWSGNAQALLQQPEVEAISNSNKGGLADWVFQYQLAVLVLLLTLVVWGLTAMNVSLSKELGVKGPLVGTCERVMLFALTSLAVRECWTVISSAGKLLILRKFVLDNVTKRPNGAGQSRSQNQEGGQ